MPHQETSHTSVRGQDASPQRGSTWVTSKRTTQTHEEMVMWLCTTDKSYRGPSHPAPIPFMALSPSKGWSRGMFPNCDVGSILWGVTLHSDLGACDLLSHVAFTMPTC
jgi:hypothetical protein